MSEWSENDMDKLFQQGAEQSGFEYKREAWEQMNKLLDRDKRRRALWWWFGGLGVLLLAGVLWFQRGGQSGSKTENDIPAKETVEKNKPVAGSQATISGKKAVEPPVSDAEKAMAEQQMPVTPELSFSEKTGTQINKRKNAARATGSAIKPPAGRVGEWQDKKEPAQPAIALPSVDPEKTATQGSTPEPRKMAGNIALLPQLTIGLHYEPAPVTLVNEGHFKELLKQTDLPEPPANSLVFGALAASELSSVGMGDFSRVSWKAGVHLEYGYAGRYGFGIGLNYLKMNYLAEKGEFNPAKDFWIDKTEPEKTDGICDVIELPVTVSFYSNGHSRSGLFASLGMTSLFMQREYYSYEYYSTDPGLLKEWRTNKNSRYWFGIGTVSAGYYKKLPGKTALLIAPYAQFPLTGVGSGHVRLYSIGTSVRFDFRLR